MRDDGHVHERRLRPTTRPLARDESHTRRPGRPTLANTHRRRRGNDAAV